MENVFSGSLKTTCRQRNLRQTNCLLFNLWIHWPKHQIFQIAKCQMHFFVIAVTFIIQKLKSKHFVCPSFLWWQVFWGNERKYFTHIPIYLWNVAKINWKQPLFHIHSGKSFLFSNIFALSQRLRQPTSTNALPSISSLNSVFTSRKVHFDKFLVGTNRHNFWFLL